MGSQTKLTVKTQITAPVTPELLAELIQTEKFLAQYKNRGARLKDAEHYGAAAVQLEALTKAILTAQTSVSLLGLPAIGARFHVGAGTGLLQCLDRVTMYLTDTAAELLRKSNLSRVEDHNTTEVLNWLTELVSRITEDIRVVANNDLNSIRGKGVELLVATADVVAKIQGGDGSALSA